MMEPSPTVKAALNARRSRRGPRLWVVCNADKHPSQAGQPRQVIIAELIRYADRQIPADLMNDAYRQDLHEGACGLGWWGPQGTVTRDQSTWDQIAHKRFRFSCEDCSLTVVIASPELRHKVGLGLDALAAHGVTEVDLKVLAAAMLAR